MNLYERLKKCGSTSPYFTKDLVKAAKANKFIGRGSMRSSTNMYKIAAGDLANCTVYTHTDFVFVSVEGARNGRHPLCTMDLIPAIKANVTFVSDNSYDRNRPYNCGERELATFLLMHGYRDNNGIWTK